jgi:hypothetical protein
MTKAIEDISSLPGRKVLDQDETPLGEVKAIFATEDGFPMWIEIESKLGLFGKEMAIIPLARIKEEREDLRVPYSKDHVLGAPKAEDDCISAERDQELRGYYGIGAADQEMWSDNKSYVTLVTEESSACKRVEDPGDLDTPDSDKRTEETTERVRDPGSQETRDISAEDVLEQGADAGVDG